MKVSLTPHHVLNAAGGPRMADVLRDAMRDAVEVSVAVAFVHMSGLQLLLTALKAAPAARVRVLTSTYLDVTEPQALCSLRATLGDNLRVQHGPRGFHAKCHLLVLRGDRRVGWVGSSNWTLSGLRDNIEWNTRVDEPDAFQAAQTEFESLWSRDDVRAIDDAFIKEYAAQREPRALTSAVDDPRSHLADAKTAYLSPPQPTLVQQEALRRLAAMRDEGAERALVVAATGTGKTLLAAFEAERSHAQTLLFVAHRKDIVTQAEREFARVFGESPARDVLVEGAAPTGRPFVFVTIQGLLGAAGAALLTRAYDLVVVDEFHHAEAPGWQRALGSLKTRFLLGLTATPERADGRNVMELCDWNVAYEIRLPAAIRDGFLLPFHYFGIADDTVDYERVPRRNGAFVEDALGEALSLTERADLLLRHAIEKGYDGPRRVAVAFCAGVAHARFMCDEFERRSVRAAVVYGETPLDERARIYVALQDPKDPLEWLFVAEALNEGVDLPAINTVAFLRPTESSVVFLQQLGRGLRKHPSTRLLTVLDLVGRHRGAFEPLRALHDPSATPTARSTLVSRAVGTTITPPEGCEILLEDRTIEVLEKVRAMTRTRAEKIEDLYQKLKAELGHVPRPIDFWSRPEVTLREVYNAHGGWSGLRVKMGDANAWERELDPEGALAQLLRAAEKNLQQPRVYGYAALWAASDPTRDLVAEYDRFFNVHPQWKVEQRETTEGDRRTFVHENLTAVLRRASVVDVVRTKDQWKPAIEAALRKGEVRDALRERLLPTLAADHQLRHGGVLRTPDALRRFAAYSRQEIVNHFGEQYDPARHNVGVVKMRLHARHYALLASLDTSGAREEHQYENRFDGPRRFVWSSQNKMSPTNAAGSIIARQRELGVTLHLFVAPRTHAPSRYLGEVTVERHKSERPMCVWFALPEAVPDAVLREIEGE